MLLVTVVAVLGHLYFLSNKKKLIIKNLKNPYLGVDYSNNYIEQEINKKN